MVVSKIVNKALKLKIFPDEEMKVVLEQNMGNARFVWNNILSKYNSLYSNAESDDDSLGPSINLFNSMLKDLKEEYSFLREGESTSQQQVYRDLFQAFQKYLKEGAGYPRFKSKKNKKQSFRIQKVGNNIRASNRRIRLAKLGFVHFRTSKEYKQLLKSSKINNVTVKRENGEYFAIVNIETVVEELEKTNTSIGIDLGLKQTATISNGQEIANLDLEKEEKRIRFYQRKLARQQKGSKNYQKTLKKYYNYINKINNKKDDAYHKTSKNLVKNYDLIAMEILNIKGMFQIKNWAPKLQKISLYKLLEKIRYKCQWYGKEFVQIDRFYPSTKKCHKCGYKNNEITLAIREWTCPKCGETHHRT